MPRPRDTPDAEALQRLRKAGTSRRKADAELREAVIAASRAGGSVRVIAEVGQLSTFTVRTWIKEARDSPES
ncbi:hypothetical protein [Curtobacterium flaccumfaciens]|uniref:hypothetical protein n=1 Tax=Curtobacterium flaccumfaciens TaxID=2035 RepID=UPI001E5EFD70|nr:hypothetical protein [Curtobacterium allii]MCE0459522.1 hypothetical protein [Curtobacterium allii]